MNSAFPLDYSYLNQHTLREPLVFSGRGLYAGQQISMSVLPGEPDAGYRFDRSDLAPAQPQVLARWDSVMDAGASLTIGNSGGVKIRAVEHILAALFARGVDNARIVLNGPEVPAIEGNAAAFCALIDKIGTLEQAAPRRAIGISRPMSIRDGDEFAAFNPGFEPWCDIELEPTGPFAERRVISMPAISSPVISPQRRSLGIMADLALLGAYFIGYFSSSARDHALNDILRKCLMLDEDNHFHTSLETVYADWWQALAGTVNKCRH